MQDPGFNAQYYQNKKLEMILSKTGKFSQILWLRVQKWVRSLTVFPSCNIFCLKRCFEEGSLEYLSAGVWAVYTDMFGEEAHWGSLRHEVHMLCYLMLPWEWDQLEVVSWGLLFAQDDPAWVMGKFSTSIFFKAWWLFGGYCHSPGDLLVPPPRNLSMNRAGHTGCKWELY